MAHYWVSNTSQRELLRFSVGGGFNRFNEPFYVGRCYHEGDLLPASTRSSSGYAYVSLAGRLHAKDEYELLVGPGYDWAPCQSGEVPHNAVSSGNCSRDEPLYIGRGHYYGSLYVGKVHASHKCLYIPFGSQEIRISNYELLVQAPACNWLPANLEYPPPDTVVAGNESDGTAIYVARAMHDGVLLPAKFVPDRGEAYVVSDGCQSRRTQEIEILCGPNYTWLQPENNNYVPSNAVFTDRLHDGVPSIVGRAKYENSLIPGLVSADGNCVIIPFGINAVRVKNYEVLIRRHP